MGKRIVAGNWKMNNNVEESIELASQLAELVGKEGLGNVTAVVCPTSLSLHAVQQKLAETDVKVGGQNCYTKDSGAYTGEVSASMLKAAGADHVILGHSERREYFEEGDDLLADKVNAVLANGLTPIFCCGETLEQREAGIHFDFVKSQLTNSLFDLSEEQFSKVVIAYEPIWAIGTGVTASSAQAQEMHKLLRDHIATKYGQDTADSTSLLYGGSCKPDNAQELFACPDVDGGLIGGASLKARDFLDIIKSY